MSEQIPNDSHELSITEHEKIIFLLYALDFKHGEGSADLCHVFDESEYRELPVYGYESVTVGAIDGLLTLELVRLPDCDDSQTDTYSYGPDDRSLMLETTIEHHHEFVTSLQERYRELLNHVELLSESSQEAYSSLEKKLRSLKEWAGALKEYEEIGDMLATRLEAAENNEESKEAIHKLDMRDLRNEASVLDLFTSAAAADPDIAELLEDYRQPLPIIQAMEDEIDTLIERIDSEIETVPVRVGKPQMFIALLDMVCKLEKTNR